MDKVADRLREDAAAIDVAVSAELDERIRASLHSVSPTATSSTKPSTQQPWFWWASSLTGVAVAIALVAVVNLGTPDPVPTATPSPNPVAVLPPVQWQVETAVLTSPLEQEMDDLESDLRKAEELLRRDMDAVF